MGKQVMIYLVKYLWKKFNILFPALALTSVSALYIFGFLSVVPDGMRDLFDIKFYTNILYRFAMIVAMMGFSVRLVFIYFNDARAMYLTARGLLFIAGKIVPNKYSNSYREICSFGVKREFFRDKGRPFSLKMTLAFMVVFGAFFQYHGSLNVELLARIVFFGFIFVVIYFSMRIDFRKVTMQIRAESIKGGSAGKVFAFAIVAICAISIFLGESRAIKIINNHNVIIAQSDGHKKRSLFAVVSGGVVLFDKEEEKFSFRAIDGSFEVLEGEEEGIREDISDFFRVY